VFFNLSISVGFTHQFYSAQLKENANDGGTVPGKNSRGRDASNVIAGMALYITPKETAADGLEERSGFGTPSKSKADSPVNKLIHAFSNHLVLGTIFSWLVAEIVKYSTEMVFRPIVETSVFHFLSMFPLPLFAWIDSTPIQTVENALSFTWQSFRRVSSGRILITAAVSGLTLLTFLWDLTNL
jgi:hypothetical protein